jgi:hypothetical protein
MNWLDDILKEFPAIAVAKERLEYWQKRYDEFERENAVLRGENDRLKRENAEMHGQIEGQLHTAGFIEAEGVLWRRKPNGEYEKNPYCPICKLAMTPSPPMLPTLLSCIRCSFAAPFRPDNLQKIISTLPK